MTIKKKKRCDDDTYIVDVDPESGEILDFMWDEAPYPPPIVKGTIKKKGGANGEAKPQ